MDIQLYIPHIIYYSDKKHVRSVGIMSNKMSNMSHSQRYVLDDPQIQQCIVSRAVCEALSTP